MTVTPIAFEVGRFTSPSKSKPNEWYVIDLMWQEEPWSKPRPFCGCPQCSWKHLKTCKHIEAAVEHERKRLGI